MAQSKKEIAAILSGAGVRPRRRLGQNFMVDRNMVRAVVEAGEVRAGDAVIEVGCGTGTLTEELLARGAQVLAVEIDPALCAILRERLGNRTGVHIVEGDALSRRQELHPEISRFISAAHARKQPAKLVANLPYCIASPLIIDLLIEGTDLLVFTVQKEVAERLTAAPGGADYGLLSVLAQLLAEVRVLRTIPPQVFWPAPQVDSALVRMVRNTRPAEVVRAAAEFLRQIFSSRRKTLRRAMVSAGYDADRVLAAAGLDGTVRAEGLAPETLLRLCRTASHTAGEDPRP